MTTFSTVAATNMPTKSVSCHLSHVVAVTVVSRLIPYYSDYVSVNTVHDAIFRVERDLSDIVPISLDFGTTLIYTLGLLAEHDIKISARRR